MEISVISKIKKSSAQNLLKYDGLQLKINKYYCFELSLISGVLKMDLQKYI